MIGRSGKLYLAAILDLFSRLIVGWAVSAVNDRHLTIKAIQMALKRRCPDAGLLHHSDQGCTGRFKRSSQHLTGEELRWEHRNVVGHTVAVAESFFSTVKSEVGERFDSHGDAKMALFNCIEVFDNQRRRHSPLGQISPVAFERRGAA